MYHLQERSTYNLAKRTFSWLCLFFTILTATDLILDISTNTYGSDFYQIRIALKTIILSLNIATVFFTELKKPSESLLEKLGIILIAFNFIFTVLSLLFSTINFYLSSINLVVLSCVYLFAFSFFVTNQIFTTLFGVFLLLLSIFYLQYLKPFIYLEKHSQLEAYYGLIKIVPIGIASFILMFTFNRWVNTLLIKDLDSHTEKLSKLAYTDQVTGVPNSLQLTKDIQVCESNVDFDVLHCIMLGFHLDGLESINESQGIEFAGKVLKELANNYKTSLIEAKENNLGFEILDGFSPLYRIESNTFVSLINVTNPKVFNPSKLDLLKSSIDSIVSQFSNKIVLGFFGGFATYPEDANNLNQLLKNILMLVHSKHPNNVMNFMPFDQETYNQYVRKDIIKNSIAPALSRDEFRLVYQPKTIVSNDAILGFESLARWTNPEHGIVSPGEFIPLAEESGLINELTTYLFDSAMLFLDELLKNGIRCPVSINLSPSTINPSYLEELYEKLKDSGNASLIEFEITEGIVMKMSTEISSTFRKLKNLGVTFSIDDFGTGYSNLGYLQSFEAEVFKIDKSFIDGIPYNENTKKLVKTIIQMGKTFGMYVVAEGVESEEQKVFLAEQGCDVIQGYFYSKPLEPNDALLYAKNGVIESI